MTRSTPTTLGDVEIVDDRAGLVLRRIPVGPLATNCWVAFSSVDRAAVIIDPGDEPSRILDATRDLDVRAVVLTHSHWDHVLGLPHVADHLGVAVLMHPHDQPVWPHELDHLHRCGHFDAGTATDDLLESGAPLSPPAHRPIWDGVTTSLYHRQILRAGHLALTVIHTPGHTPGSVTLHTGDHALTGDTLFPGGPGLTGWPLSDFATIIDSIRTRLLILPGSTRVHPGHGASTTIDAERSQLTDWIQRGW